MKLFTVGPVEMYENTLELGKMQVPYFRNHFFSDIMFELDSNIKKALDMEQNDRNIILTASGTGAMEAVILNCLTEHDKVLIISGGTFGKRFEQLCELYEIPYDVITIPFGETFSEESLNAYEGKGYTVLLVNIHETSIGQLYPIRILSDFCQRNHMLFYVDAISSVFADKIDFMKDKIDVLIFSSQKALALAPGIAVVSISEYVRRHKLNSNPKTLYFNFQDYLINEERGQTPYTPAIGIVLQMNEMLKEILKIGVEKKIEQTRNLAMDFRHKLYEFGFEVPKYPLSNALTPLWLENQATFYYQELIERFAITVNPCGGQLANNMLRVGHLGNLTIDDNDSLIQALCLIRKERI